MADHHSLQYWLESINLPQYYINFIQHGLIRRDQCECLDEESLSGVGITNLGHQKRILSHLPNVENWIEDKTVLPNLPPKRKTIREAFLYQDLKPPDSLSINISSNDETNRLHTDPALNCHVSPRPVPAPRSSRLIRSPATTPNDEKPKPTKKPTAAPRHLTSPKICLSPESLSNIHENEFPATTKHQLQEKDFEFVIGQDLASDHMGIELDSHVDISVGTKSNTSQSASTGINLHDSVMLHGVCLDETSTEESIVSSLYSFPVKNKPQGNTQSETKLNDVLGTNKRDVCVEEQDNNEHAVSHTTDALYMNVDESTETSIKNISKRVMDIGAACPTSCKNTTDTTEEYINAAFDPFSNTYIVKPEILVSNSESSLQSNNNISAATLADAAPAICSGGEDAGNRDNIYEPIWDNLEDTTVKTALVNHDLPSIMQFTPLDKGSNSPVVVRPKEKHSTFNVDISNDRLSSFDMPPPQFAPPPLPPGITRKQDVGNSSMTSMPDVIADFDPLTSSATPAVPPRPSNYAPPLFKPYENVAFQMGAESLSLPGHFVNMEPEIDMFSPDPIGLGYQDARVSTADDPFKYEDPFGQFKPDCDDFDTDMFPPASCQESGLRKSFVSSGQTKILNIFDNGDAIYEAAEDPDEFDAFSLNRKESETTIARSISSGSSGSQYRLSEVPPAPKWYQGTPDTTRMYSVATNSNDVDSSSTGSLDDLINGDSSISSIDDVSGVMMQVEILPATALSPRRKERSGYLYKQGGVRQNRGWRKRWMIFDGKTLRYYSSAKDQVSKRIVPLSCMTNVEMDVKPNNSRQYKFKLHCTNRVFLFATDSLDDCKMWSNTLMEAILTYGKPPGGEVDGGDMANPDIDAWIKINKNRYKFYMALKAHKLCYYQNDDDFKMASPLHEIDMKLASVKEMDRTKLQLNTHYSTFMLHFESSSDASNWKMAIEEAITDALGDNTILDQVKENPDNGICADCGATEAHWASMNLAIVLCLRCAGIHRGFDPRMSKVRSLRMDTRVWNSSLIEMYKEIGNDNANNFWVKNMPPGTSINANTPSEVRKQHIHNKYKEKLYCDKHPLSEDKLLLNEALILAAQTENVLLTYQILLSGADVLYYPPGQPNCTAFEMAQEAHQRIQMEFLLQNCGDKTKNFMPGSEEASLVAKLRAEVQLQGYLQKTGSNMKDFLKRWCVLEHGHISYYMSEESKVEKDRIDNESILCIQAVHNDKQVGCFEISSKKNNRVYLFASASVEERLQWMRSIAQVFCPVDLMDQVKQRNISLAGYAHIKTGFNSDWQRIWFLLEHRNLIFIDKGETEREQDNVDLRKVSSITKISQSQTVCEACLETQGPQFVLKASERMLYFQADLIKDTERIFSALEVAAKKGGDLLEDQALTHDDIPIIISSCINFIEQNGLTLDGLYRKADQESKIKTLLHKFQEDARSVVLRTEEESVHLVCNVMKRFLRNLSDPLLTAQLYKRWIQTAGEMDHNVKLQWYKYLLQQLPRINYLTLRYLASHLSKLSKHAVENLMNLHNISIAFGSTLMKSDKAGEPIVNASDVGSAMQLEMKVISDIVTYFEWLFDMQEDHRKSSVVEDKIREAQRKMEEISRQTMVQSNDMIIFVYHRDPTSNAESVKINKDTTVADVVHTLTTKLKLTSSSWTLHELIKTDIERPLDPDMKLWPLIHEWQNWTREYCAAASLCLKASTLRKKLELAYDPSKPLFGEMKYCEKRRFVKMAFEFTQAKLSYYKDAKNVNNPAGSWNIEDLSIYMGCDSKRSPPTKFTFTFLIKGDKIGEKDLPCFGRTVCCASQQDLLSWMAGLTMAQHPSCYSR